jgi:hypothetical protein
MSLSLEKASLGGEVKLLQRNGSFSGKEQLTYYSVHKIYSLDVIHSLFIVFNGIHAFASSRC